MFKDKLKQLRMEKNLTQAEVAQALNVSAATIGNYEQGTREPRNNYMWKALADIFDVSVDELMDKRSSVPETSNNIRMTKSSDRKAPFNSLFRTDKPIIYDNVDITRLVLEDSNSNGIQITSKQMFAYTEFNSRSGHVIFARRNLLKIIDKIQKYSVDEIKDHLNEIVKWLESNVVHWYKRCWNNIDDLFPKVTDLSTLYDLIDRCLGVDMVACDEFYLEKITENIIEDFDWLRKKLN